MPRFGPAGNPQAFYDEGFKSSEQMPAWLAALGLSAYEYQCGNGVRIGSGHASQIGEAALAADIQMSLHAPYYINLATLDPEKQIKTAGYIFESLRAANAMLATRVVLHPGSALHPEGRAGALQAAGRLLGDIIRQADEQSLLQTCTLCPEVMGKINQLGDLEEVMMLCQQDDRLVPCVDFGHLNARTHGGLKDIDDFRQVFRLIANALGWERARCIHVHFSRIEYSAGGEKMHHRLVDTQYGPDFEPLAAVMQQMDLDPVIICESDGTQAEDALTMKQLYESQAGKNAEPGKELVQ